MQLKIRGLKFITKTMIVLGVFIQCVVAQEGSEVAVASSIDSVTPFKPFKVDGVAGVVGDYVILEGDIDRALYEIKTQGETTVDVTRCQVMGKLLEDKLLTHHAIQDSIVVRDGQINSEVDQVLERFTQALGSQEKVLEYYKKENIADLRAELFQIRKDLRLGQMMNTKIIESVEITPDEVRSFFKRIPEEDMPTFGVELEIARIVIEPKATEKAKQEAIDRLNQFRVDIVENGSSFATKAVLYTDDEGSRGEGGFMSVNRRSPLVKEFRDVIFGLQEGEVSEPFETEYGFHIATLEKIKGDNLEIRHILLIPEIGKAEEEEAKDKINRIRQRLVDGELDFAEAAREFSDEKETKFDGGVLVNPVTLDKRFELSKLDPILYTKVSNLKDGEISLVFNDPSRTGKTRYMILTVNNRYEEHKADFAKDYVKIKELALREKQINAIQKWQSEKIKETYIKVNGANRDCDFNSDWIKN